VHSRSFSAHPHPWASFVKAWQCLPAPWLVAVLEGREHRTPEHCGCGNYEVIVVSTSIIHFILETKRAGMVLIF
jgi:hypothetical protein